MRTYPELVELVQRCGWLPDPPRLLRNAARRRGDADLVLAAAQQLREALFQVFSAVAAGASVPPQALATVELRGTAGLATLHLDPAGTGYRLRWRGANLEQPLHLAGASAVLLLTGAEVGRVKQCPGPTCGWLFLDTTRNRSRRWCETSECGNRNRVQAHYRRSRARA
jgi:predicted RNA-binding Zn ribbon-like protein